MNERAFPLERCPVCHGAWGAPVAGTAGAWARQCGSCGFLASDLEPAVQDAMVKTAIEETQREEALRELRIANFRLIFDRIAALAELRGRKVLDIGCAHGWFLEEAARRGASASGIEPDQEIAAIALARGLDVRVGFFPDALPAEERFGLVAFNDVLEHLPDVDGIVAAVARHLEEDGLVSVNIPLSTGFFFRMAKLLDGLGIRSPIRRMWQEGLPSPHLSYFSQDQLKTLFARHGLEEVHRSALPTLGRSGLWERISYTPSIPRLAVPFIWLGVTAVRPVINWMPADIGLQVFRRVAARPG